MAYPTSRFHLLLPFPRSSDLNTGISREHSIHTWAGLSLLPRCPSPGQMTRPGLSSVLVVFAVVTNSPKSQWLTSVTYIFFSPRSEGGSYLAQSSPSCGSQLGILSDLRGEAEAYLNRAGSLLRPGTGTFSHPLRTGARHWPLWGWSEPLSAIVPSSAASLEDSGSREAGHGLAHARGRATPLGSCC